jgi:hypothetical protein
VGNTINVEMKARSFWISMLISISPILLALLWIMDMIDVFFGDGDYPFGSAFFSPISIYHSKTVYVTYHVVEILALIAMVYFTFKRRWKLFYILLVINAILFLYPILTAES